MHDDVGARSGMNRIVLLKLLVFIACLLPLGQLIALAATDALGANPIEAVTRDLGDWALRFLLITLAVTPLRRLTGWSGLMRLRRMLGLFVFFYAGLHLTSYVLLDQFFDWSTIATDILKRPYITVGMGSFIILLILAVTSLRSMQARLGGKRWQRIHRLVYLAGVGAVLHYYWLVKADTRIPIVYGIVLVVLLGLRLPHRTKTVIPSALHH